MAFGAQISRAIPKRPSELAITLCINMFGSHGYSLKKAHKPATYAFGSDSMLHAFLSSEKTKHTNSMHIHSHTRQKLFIKAIKCTVLFSMDLTFQCITGCATVFRNESNTSAKIHASLCWKVKSHVNIFRSCIHMICESSNWMNLT